MYADRISRIHTVAWNWLMLIAFWVDVSSIVIPEPQHIVHVLLMQLTSDMSGGVVVVCAILKMIKNEKKLDES